jgi:phage tail-like protein
MPMYTVKKGDWLQKIAEQKGLKSWHEIYDNPANAAFKKSHPNPNLIYPGDKIFVPDPAKPPAVKPKPPATVKPPAATKPKPGVKPPAQKPAPKDPAPASPKQPPQPKVKKDTSRPFDHQAAFRFRIELGGIQAGAFRSVEGLGVSVEMIEYQGGGDMYARQIPGRPKIAPVVLKKGYVNTSFLWDWMKSNMQGNIQLENVSVVLLTDDGQSDLARYELTDCWPSSWKGWQLDANASNAMVEEIELQVRMIERVEG